MKYMLLTYLDEKAWTSLSEAEQQQMMAECTPHVEQLLASKKFWAALRYTPRPRRLPSACATVSGW
jgi:hypothetical protein